MRNSLILAAGLLAAATLSGCAHRSYAHKGPDEFVVAREAPLVIPPDFSLPPPRPGATRPQDVASNAQTLDALFGGPAPRSAAETAAIDQAGSDDDDDDTGARSTAGDPGTTVVNKGATTRDIVAAPAGDGQDARAATP